MVRHLHFEHSFAQIGAALLDFKGQVVLHYFRQFLVEIYLVSDFLGFQSAPDFTELVVEQLWQVLVLFLDVLIVTEDRFLAVVIFEEKWVKV